MTKTNLLFCAFAALVLLPPAVRAENEPKGPVFCRYVPERKDDFAWENELVAFRAYGPALKGSAEHENSGIDCWFKSAKSPIIDRWYAGEQKGISYHKDHGEGYDGYHVGSSRGCGGTALWKDGKMVLAGVYTAQRVVSLTPEACVFELTYRYEGEGSPVQEIKRITLRAGERLFRSESTFTRDGRPVELEVAVGVTTQDERLPATHLSKQDGWLACWGTIDGKGAGTGVVMDPARITNAIHLQSQAPDESHVLFLTRTGPDGKEVHYAGFAWAGAGEIKTAQEWEQFLGGFKAPTEQN